MTVFGDLITGVEVTDAIKAFIQRWSPSYIAEVGERNGFTRAELPAFRSYESSAQEDKKVEDQIPACIVVVPGLADEPTRSGRGKYTARWAVTIMGVVSANDFDATDKLAKLYPAAIRALFVQKGSIDGFASSTEWLDEDYDALDFDDSRTLRAWRVDLKVEVTNVVDSALGPLVPPVDPAIPPSDFSLVESTHIEVRGRA